MTQKPETPSFQQLLAMVLIDFRGAAEISRFKTESRKKAFQKSLWEQWAVAYCLAVFLDADIAAWHRFATDVAWGNRTLDPDHKLRFALQYIDGHVSGPEAELSCTHANALEAAFLAKVPAAKIPAYIEQHGGIGKLLKAYRKSKREAAAAAHGGTGYNKGRGSGNRKAVPRIVMPLRVNGGSQKDPVSYSECAFDVPSLITQSQQLALPAPLPTDAAEPDFPAFSGPLMYPAGSMGMWKLEVFVSPKLTSLRSWT